MSSPFKSFAVIGAGAIGNFIVEALAATTGISVVVFSRSASKSLPPGAKVVVIGDYGDKALLAKAFKDNNVEVAISTLGHQGLSSQLVIIDAAGDAGVKLFAPSEFAAPYHESYGDFVRVKIQAITRLESIGLPWVKFYTGGFIGWIPWLLNSDKGTAQIIGKGNTPFSLTAEKDIGGFVAHVLTTLHPSELENRTFRIQGDRLTVIECAKILDDGIKIEYVESIDGPMGAFQTLIQSLIEKGYESTGWDPVNRVEGTGDNAAGAQNGLWPNHKWVTVKEFYANKK